MNVKEFKRKIRSGNITLSDIDNFKDAVKGTVETVLEAISDLVSAVRESVTSTLSQLRDLYRLHEQRRVCYGSRKGRALYERLVSEADYGYSRHQ